MKVKKYIIRKIVSLNPKRFSFLSDEIYLQLKFYDAFGRFMDFSNPKTFNEKLQWLKVYNHRPEYTQMVDKYAVKQYVSDKIGNKYIIPTLGVWETFDDIDFDKLPNQFVLKCTHDSGGLVICKDKAKLDMKSAKKKIDTCLKNNYFYMGREWPYKNVKPRIIAEQYLSNDDQHDELSDYKVLCFNGVPRLVEIHKGRFSGHHTQDFYDIDWKKTKFEQPDDPLSDEIMDKPVFAKEMFELTSVLAAGIPHVRVDWYYTKGKLLFGEITFFDGSGFFPFIDNQDEILGSWITLPSKFL